MDIDLEKLNLAFLKEKEVRTVLNIGEIFLGVPKNELGWEFIQAFDDTAIGLDKFLHKDLHTLLWLFNSHLMSLFLKLSFHRFDSMSKTNKELYVRKWMTSPIPILRTGFRTFQALSGWSYYSLEKSYPEMKYPGHTIGREHELVEKYGVKGILLKNLRDQKNK